jgi:rhodanese-related sulfurtransferase
MSSTAQVSVTTLKQFQPLDALSETRLEELSALCFVERVSRQLDPFRLQALAGKAVYLLRGELALTQKDGRALVLVGGTDEARHPIGRKANFVGAKAITDVELFRIDDDLIDIMATWDQLAQVEGSPRGAPNAVTAKNSSQGGDWRLMTGMFSMNNLRHGAFARLPTAHIAEMLGRFERLPVKRGETVVREGDDGEHYFILEQGRAQVTRKVGGVDMKLAQLKAGDAFGEEALLSDGKRNATVTMLVEGMLLRLAKADFNLLLRKPLLQELELEAARDKVRAGGLWIDVRYPSEHQYDKVEGSLNIPLAEVRNAPGILDAGRDYIVYCQTGRRSSAAAFLLAQRGFNAFVLAGGLAANPAIRPN